MEHIPILRILYLYYGTYSCISDLIRVLQNIYLSYGSYTCVTELILGFRILYWYYGAYPCTSDLIRSLFSYFGYGSSRRYYRTFYLCKIPIGTIEQIHYTEVPIGTTDLYLFYQNGSTRRYYWTYTYFTDTRVPVVLQNLIRYRSTHRYYRTDTEVHSDLYSYSLFRVLSYNYLTTRPIIRSE